MSLDTLCVLGELCETIIYEAPMNPRDIFLHALTPRTDAPSRDRERHFHRHHRLMKKTGFSFPEGAHRSRCHGRACRGRGHGARLRQCHCTLFSVCHESAAIGCVTDWGAVDRMPPTARAGSTRSATTSRFPPIFTHREECRGSLAAIGILKKNGSAATPAVVGKVFGPGRSGITSSASRVPHQHHPRSRCGSALDGEAQGSDRGIRPAQIDAGADALTLGDHATRDLCSLRHLPRFPHGHPSRTRGSAFPARHPPHLRQHRRPYRLQSPPPRRLLPIRHEVTATNARELDGERHSLMGGQSNFDIVPQGHTRNHRRGCPDKEGRRIDIIGPESAVPLDAKYENLRMIAEEAKRG